MMETVVLIQFFVEINFFQDSFIKRIVPLKCSLFIYDNSKTIWCIFIFGGGHNLMNLFHNCLKKY